MIFTGLCYTAALADIKKVIIGLLLHSHVGTLDRSVRPGVCGLRLGRKMSPVLLLKHSPNKIVTHPPYLTEQALVKFKNNKTNLWPQI